MGGQNGEGAVGVGGGGDAAGGGVGAAPSPSLGATTQLQLVHSACEVHHLHHFRTGFTNAKLCKSI